MKKILSFLFISFALFSASRDGGFGFGSIRAEKLNLSTLNQELTSKGYQGLSEDFFGFGGGGYGKIGRILLGGEGYGSQNSASYSGSDYIQGNFGYGFFNVGLVIVETKKIIIYPVAGFGGYGFTINIKENGVKKEYSGSGTLLNGGIGLDYKEKKSGVMVGLKAGYITTPLNSNYEDFFNKGHKITGSYVSLTFGGGGY